MTLGQFSVAVGASPRWVQNARAALPLGGGYTVEKARRLALARALRRTCGMPLVEAYAAAGEALAGWPESRHWERTGSDGVAVAVDLERFLGAFAARLSLARTLYGERERGRPRKVRRRGLALARDHGVDVGLLEASLARTPAERLRSLDRDVEFLRSLRPARVPAPRVRRSRPRKSRT
jgi:hypothetical protein